MAADKKAHTAVSIHDVIAKRWSPRSFVADRPVTSEQMLALIEAARWAPSCFGDEPWRYIIFNRFENQAAWDRAFACLAEKNQLWAKAAPVLLLAVAGGHFSKNNKPNRWGQYDTGAASENLCLQATAMGLMAHQMGGFDAEKVKTEFAIPEGYTPMAMIAVGHQGGIDTLHEDFVESEQAPRHRRPVEECFFSGGWNIPFRKKEG